MILFISGGIHMARLNLTGQKYGKLLVLYPGEPVIRKTGHKKTTWVCKCDCGKIVTIQTESLRSGRANSCGCKNAELRREDLTNQRFGKLIAIKPDTPHYTSGGNSIPHWICQCDCGNIVSVSTRSLKNGNTRSCGCLRAETMWQKTELLIGQKFGYLTILERVKDNDDNSDRKRVKYKCKCDCGSIVIVRGEDLKSGKTQSCGCLKSKGEAAINQWLTKNKINFKTQYNVPNMKYTTGYYPYFDFAIFDNNNNLCFLIEYQGDIHYKSRNSGWNTDENLKNIQQRDIEKRKLCNFFKIELVEIPYWNFNNIETILTNLMKKHNLME